MIDALLDTSIIVDILRDYAPAVDWLENNTEELGITYYTWLEIIQGCNSKREERLVIGILKRFVLVPTTDEDSRWATEQLIVLHLKLNVDKMDCLIAAPSYRLQVPTYTRNLKHFQPLLNDLAITPYSL